MGLDDDKSGKNAEFSKTPESSALPQESSAQEQITFDESEKIDSVLAAREGQCWDLLAIIQSTKMAYFDHRIMNLSVDIEGVSMEKIIEPLLDFYREGFLKMQEYTWKDELKEMDYSYDTDSDQNLDFNGIMAQIFKDIFPENPPAPAGDFNINNLLRESGIEIDNILIPKFRTPRSKELQIRRQIYKNWIAKHYAFLFNPELSAIFDPRKTALQCFGIGPLKSQYTVENVADAGSLILRGQTAIIEELARLVAYPPIKKGEFDQRTRKIYALIQGIIQVSLMLSPTKTRFATPSTEIFKEGTDQKIVENYIEARLMHILSPTALMFQCDQNGENGYIDEENGNEGQIKMLSQWIYAVQEDFVSIDLQALAEKFGLGEKYEKIFRGLQMLRQMQFVTEYHFPVILDLIQNLVEMNGKAPVVSVLGSGRQMLETIFAEHNLIESCYGVDVDREKTLEETRTASAYRRKNKVIGAKELISDTPKGKKESPELMKEVFKDFPNSDLIIIADTLHEITGDFQGYVLEAYKRLKPGGYLYITDPAFCKAIDEITEKTLNKYDSTINVKSMRPIEDYFEVINKLMKMGAIIRPPEIAFEGYKDCFFRARYIIQKPPESAAA